VTEAEAAFNAPITPPDGLEALARSQLEHAIDGVRRGLKVYESLSNLNDVIGTQYGDRVLYELLQNAHDAHDKDCRDGEIAIDLIIRSEADGELRISNRGRGFTFKDLDSIRNIGTSNKEIGESIGNKGLGFRSVEALTDDVHVYSQSTATPARRFDGYCFRFATKAEIVERLAAIPDADGYRAQVAATIPRYLIALPPLDQSDEIQHYADEGFATVVVLPLRTIETISLARKQV
jgi:anti-sigma regulatory factor (Ser/Thr protein kinase)